MHNTNFMIRFITFYSDMIYPFNGIRWNKVFISKVLNIIDKF